MTILNIQSAIKKHLAKVHSKLEKIKFVKYKLKLKGGILTLSMFSRKTGLTHDHTKHLTFFKITSPSGRGGRGVKAAAS